MKRWEKEEREEKYRIRPSDGAKRMRKIRRKIRKNVYYGGRWGRSGEGKGRREVGGKERERRK